ncbi:MAG TPA: histidine kinase [Acidimicrobiaceae bacterium]|nr:histidine kinase [Acidimicrobiaceae bacterium]
MARGVLRIYLGAAPGVGKTYAMLNEGRRRAARGADVVIAVVETHGRARTLEQIGDLPIVPRRSVQYRGATFEEMDVDAVIARAPQVALVDELAHTNTPGMRNERRWQDVVALLDAGIDVVSTVNVQHLESLNDVVERITGVVQRETVPDAVVRNADQIELVDMSPEALRRRLAHGNVYPPERVDTALANYFRPGNLAALRELALLWVADRVEESLLEYLTDHGIDATWETRERVVVALTGAPGGEQVIRRAARLAGRLRGDLIAVHVASPDGLSTSTGASLERHRALVVALGGTYREVVGDDVPAVLAAFAAGEHATQLVIGATQRSRWTELVRGSVVGKLQRRLTGVDLHVIATEDAALPSRTAIATRTRRAVPVRRERWAWVVALAGLPALTATLHAQRTHLNLGTGLLLMMAVVVVVALVGGSRPGVVAAVAASLLANWFLTPPYYTLTIAETDNLVSLFVFVAVAVAVSLLVDRAALTTREVRRARADATALARSTGSLLATDDPLPHIADQMRALFDLRAVAVLRREPTGWAATASAGTPVPPTPAYGTAFRLDDSGDVQLVLVGQIDDDDLPVLRVFTDQLGLALRSQQLRREAAAVESLTQADALRTALLRSVSHDLRTPLASIKASVTGLLSGEVGFSSDDREALLSTIDQSVDRLDRVVGNLLDMSRLEAGAATANVQPTALEEVVAAALNTLAMPTDRVVTEVSEELPLVMVDAGLLERAIANLVSNGLAWSPATAELHIEAAAVHDHVQLRVIDRGPGVRPEDRARVFLPFQRLGDRSSDAGAGLGLAIAKGFVEVCGGSIALDDTPGGGCTFTITLPIAEMAIT